MPIPTIDDEAYQYRYLITVQDLVEISLSNALPHLLQTWRLSKAACWG